MMSFLPANSFGQGVEEIRVLLLNGKPSYDHHVTLKSSTELNMTIEGAIPYQYKVKANENIAFEYDLYKLLIVETADLATVKSLKDKIEGIKDWKLFPSIEIIEKNNQTIYKLIVGQFATLEAANSFAKELGVKLQMTPAVIGPKHWVFGEYGDDVASLQAAVTALRNQGFDAYSVKVLGSKGWENQAWIGLSSSSQSHEQLKQAILAKYPTKILTEPTTQTYSMEQTAGTYINGTLVKHPQYNLADNTTAKIAGIQASSTITVFERLNNQFRGQINLHSINKSFSVVNQVSFEEYLYSVVGSEMYTGWPIEAFKAQAVSARTFAYSKVLTNSSPYYTIRDTTADQAYFGIEEETDKIRQAVEQTKGMVILYNGKPISTFYSSNAGGHTADGTEAWGNPIPYVTVRPNPSDDSAQVGLLQWYRLMRKNGQTGYVRTDYVQKTGAKNELGLEIGIISNANDPNFSTVNFRKIPKINTNNLIGSLPKGEEIVILDTVHENSSFTWISLPITPAFIQAANSSITGPVLDLKVLERGPSGRVTLLGNGTTPLTVSYPDKYRAFLGSTENEVKSTLFDIEQTGRIEVLGANGKTRSIVNQKESVYVQSSSGTMKLQESNNNQEEYVIYSGNNSIRVATKEQAYVIHGTGFGHGIGMSQWGTKGLADSGYTYDQILKYYYQNVEIKPIP